jgi:hypothetical protein
MTRIPPAQRADSATIAKAIADVASIAPSSIEHMDHWIAQMQSLLAKYRRAMKRERKGLR